MKRVRPSLHLHLPYPSPVQSTHSNQLTTTSPNLPPRIPRRPLQNRLLPRQDPLQPPTQLPSSPPLHNLLRRPRHALRLLQHPPNTEFLLFLLCVPSTRHVTPRPGNPNPELTILDNGRYIRHRLRCRRTLKPREWAIDLSARHNRDSRFRRLAASLAHRPSMGHGVALVYESWGELFSPFSFFPCLPTLFTNSTKMLIM